jgi:hypothetical protein
MWWKLRRSDHSRTDNADSHIAFLAISQPLEILDNIDVSDNDAGYLPQGDDS